MNDKERQARREAAIEDFRDYMDDAVRHLLVEFDYQARNHCISRHELKAILLEDIEEQL